MASIKVLFALIAITSMFGIAVGVNYTVGQPGGSWDSSTNLTKWISDKTFRVGDNLLFSYSTVHDVWEVTKSNYDTCAKGSPLMTYKGGNTLILLTGIGSRYFFCSVGTHCVSGQKIAVSVVSSDPSNSPPPPSSTPSVSAPPPPQSTPSASSPPPPAPPSPNGVAPVMKVGTCTMIIVAFTAMLMFLV